MSLAVCVEVPFFKFRQLKKFQISDESDKGSERSVGLLTASSRFGFVFAGHSKGFKVLQLDTILNIDEAASEKSSQKAVEQFPHMQVTLPSDPFLLALSADEMTLAVGVIKGQCPVALLYDIRVFLAAEPPPSGFLEIRLSSTAGTKVLDFFWNPSSGDTFAVCLSDGCVAVYEISSPNTFKVAGSLPFSTGATSLCWSPKGKQLVIGRRTGQLSQYKPNLVDCVKTVEQPNTFQNEMAVSSVLWLETHLFAAVYQDSQSDSQPSLILVSVPKGSSPCYLNFNDVCYGNGDGPTKYWMHHMPAWKTMVCSSSSALETAVVGITGEKGTWDQWILEDTSRAELPMIKSMETYPLGMAVISCSQKRIVVSETESYPAAPILLLLSTSGQLCPFHMIHTACTVEMTTPVEPLVTDGVRRPANVPSQSLPFPAQTAPLSVQPATPKGLSIQGNTAVLGQPVHMSTPLEAVSKPEHSANAPKTNLIQKFTEESPKPTSLFAPLTKPEAQRQELKPVASPGPLTPQPGAFIFSSSSQNGQVCSPPKSSADPSFPLSSGSLFRPTNVPTLSPLPVTTAAAGSVLPVGTTIKPTRPTLTAVAPSKNIVKMTTQDATKPTGDATYLQAFFDEVHDFQREIEELSCTLSQKLNLGTPEEMGLIRKNTQDALNFSSEIKKTLQSIQSDVTQLKSALIETFALLEEARSRDLRDRDPVYLNLLRTRALDPCSQRQLKEIRRLAQYVSGQLHEVHLKLDIDWQEQLQKSQNNQTKSASNQHGFATLYQALANNLAVIDCLETSLVAISQQCKELKSNKSYSHSNQINSMSINDLSTKLQSTTLSNSVLKAQKTMQMSNHSLNDTSLTNRSVNRTIGRQQENILRDLLTQRPVRVVKAKPIADFSQSRLVSALHSLQMSSSTPGKKSETPSPAALSQRPSSTTVLSHPVQVSTSPAPGSSLASPPPSASVAQTSAVFSGWMTKGQPFKPVTEEAKISSIPAVSKNAAVPVSSAHPVLFSTKAQSPVSAVSVQLQTATTTSAHSVFQPKTVFTTGTELFSVGKTMPTIAGAPQVSIVPAISTPLATASHPMQDFKFHLPSTSSTVVVPANEAKEICPKFENITPPETPQPAVEYQEGNGESSTPTEESKVIHISLNSEQSDGLPLVKVSTLQSSSAAQVIAGSAQPAPVINTAAQAPGNQVSFSFKAAASTPSTTPTTSFSLSHLKTTTASPGEATSSTGSIVTGSTRFQFSTPTWALGSGSAFTQPKFSFVSSADKTNALPATTISTTTATSLSSTVLSAASAGASTTAPPSTALTVIATAQSNKPPTNITSSTIAKTTTAAPTATSGAFAVASASTTPSTGQSSEPVPNTAIPTTLLEPAAPQAQTLEQSSETSKTSSGVQPTLSVPSGIFTTKPTNAAPSIFAPNAAGAPFGQMSGTLFGQAAAGATFGQATSGTTFGQVGSGATFGQETSGSTFGQANSGTTFGQTSSGTSFGQTTPGTTFGQVASGGAVFGQPATNTASDNSSTVSSTKVATATETAPTTTTTTTLSSTTTTTATVSTASITTTSETPSTSLSSSTSVPTATSSVPTAVVPATTASTTSSLEFSKPVTTSAPAAGFGQPLTATSPVTFSQAGAPAFASTPTTAVAGGGGGIFGSTVPDVTPTSSTPSVFGQVAGAVPSMFGQPVSTAPQITGIFSQPVAGQVTSPGGIFSGSGGNLGFGQPVSPSPAPPAFGQSGQSVFGKGQVFGASTFGQPPPSTTSTLTFGTMSGPFGQPVTSAFGQAPTFGQAPAFGQQNTFGQKPVFGQSGGSLFGQVSNSSTGPLFGQQQQQQQQNVGGNAPAGATPFSGNFFMGLGGKPSEENAGKNVFGGNFGTTNATGAASSNLFGSQGASTFGSSPTGGFSGSFSSGGSVAQTGFAAFQQTPPRTSGFGSPPAFGSSPVFSGSPAFGSTPGFGNSFGMPSPSAASPTFGTFGSNAAPSFDTLAAQSPTFSNLAQQSQPPQNNQAATSPTAFGSPPAFGGQFGSQSSAFSQWRQ